MGNPIFGGCPYQAEDGFNDRNRFPNGHLFVGEIENGMRYPLGVYTKQESDAKYAGKQTESDLAALAEHTAESLDDLTALVNTKASEEEAEEIRARLDALEYQGIKINTFTAAPTVCELGSTNSVQLTWSLSKSATQQNVNGIPVTGTSKRYDNIVTSTTFTLNVTDGRTSASKSVSVSFANQIYFGAASSTASVTSLSKVLSDNPERTFTANAEVGEYIIYALPVRLGTVNFFVGGFEGGFEEPELKILTNSSGYQEQYYVYRSTNANLGETTVEVREG